MPLKGGAADKYGGRYEGLWTISFMADVMSERAESIYLEPPGDEGAGVEFRIRKEGVQEYHQVKRQRGRGSWTLSALESESVLTNFYGKLNAPDAHCAFVSVDSAPQLRELSERADAATSWQNFDTFWRLRSGPNSSPTSDPVGATLNRKKPSTDCGAFTLGRWTRKA
jgi:hypothetical protein